MKHRAQLVGALVPTIAALSLLGLMAATGTAAPAPSKPAAGPQSEVAIAPDWFERAVLAAQRRAVAPDWFERAALAALRKEAIVSQRHFDVRGPADDDLGWHAAAIAASSVLALALVLGVGVTTARRYRGRSVLR